MLGTILIIVLVLWLLGYGGYGRTRWGLGNGGDIGTLILVLIILYLVFGTRLLHG